MGSCDEFSDQPPGCDPGGDDLVPINSYALVTYIPDPLGRFLDELRRELVPGCVPRAHVTVLPPRPLTVSPQLAWEELCERLRDSAPFDIEADGLRVFEQSTVLYIDLREGRDELVRLHEILSGGRLAFVEPYHYHPHITLAQEFAPVPVSLLLDQAQRRWDSFAGERRFPVESVTFVQNTAQNRWVDLAQLTLGAVPCR
jgi:2'-5' RNA ligase